MTPAPIPVPAGAAKHKKPTRKTHYEVRFTYGVPWRDRSGRVMDVPTTITASTYEVAARLLAELRGLDALKPDQRWLMKRGLEPGGQIQSVDGLYRIVTISERLDSPAPPP